MVSQKNDTFNTKTLFLEPQVRSICNHVRPDRQALLFSATFPRRVERLARDALHDPVRVQHGAAGEASDLVRQHVRWGLENVCFYKLGPRIVPCGTTVVIFLYFGLVIIQYTRFQQGYVYV